jgi:hypothetical protein
MTDEKKLYTVQGNIQTVYPAQKVESAKGNRKWTSEKTDVILQTPKGGKVRVTFWDQAVEQSIEGSDVSITNLKYGGIYKETNQFSSTKESKIHVLNATGQAQEDDPTDPSVPGLASVAEPTASEPEPDVDPTPVTASAPALAIVEPKKRGRPAKVEAPVAQVAPSAQPVSEQTRATTAQVSAHSSEALVLSNLQAAERIAKTLGYDRIGMVELITLGDMVGRTSVALRIEAGKDQRMANYRK